MKGEKYIAIGKLGKPHGVSGAFRFLLYNGLKGKKKFPKHFMVEVNAGYNPWFIKKMEWLGELEGLIWFEDITSPEQARKFSSKEIFLTEKDAGLFFRIEAGEFDYLIGYKMNIEGKEDAGVITGVNETPGQTLLLIKYQNKEIIVPLVDEFVVKLSKRKKEITLNLPEGLTEL